MSAVKPKPNTKFEMEVCTRCKGDGEYSFNRRDGNTCFKCQGKGWTYTKRGEMAYKFFEASLMKRAADFVAGDMLYDTRNGWQTVESVGPDPLNIGCIVIVTDKCAYHFEPDTQYRAGHTAEEKAPKLQAALAYQDTL